MSQNLTELNVNPCKMCQPLGSSLAFFGIARSMTILHGSQGCATYMRRHMATHYNEPIDIASTSFTEEGAVFGGERNLKKGLANMCRLYHPDVVGVATTCLAETIGEPVERFIQEFYDDNPEAAGVTIIPVASAGYGGTHYEGYFHALRAIVEHVPQDRTPTAKINVIMGPASPADVRAVRALLDEMGLAYTMLPDISDNLDAPRDPEYSRLKSWGTTIDEIRAMAGARATLELAPHATGKLSAGEYLRDTFAVPLVRLPLPCGLRDTDEFVQACKRLGGVVTERMRKERGRLLDAMVDAHKHSATGRACIYGSPDQVRGLVRLACENGCVPAVVATGADCPEMLDAIKDEVLDVAQRMHADEPILLNKADFDDIEDACLRGGANILIGSSDGRRVARKLDLPLVRCAFPCHDHIGGQRVRTLLYDGAMSMIDNLCNALIDRRDLTFRQDMYDAYHDKAAGSVVGETSEAGVTDEGVRKMSGRLQSAVAVAPGIYAGETSETALPEQDSAVSGMVLGTADTLGEVRRAAEVLRKTAEHPCFNGCNNTYGRMHVPVAPACNIQCNYCVRDFDCPNESRPGVTSEILSPEAARDKFLAVRERMPNLKVLGIAGPGDTLANWSKTSRTLQLIREAQPDVTFCLSTNGLMLPVHVDELAALGVTHLTVTMNTIDPKIGAKIYAYVNYMGTRFEGIEAASILLANQLAGIKRACELGMVVKVNTVVLKGINDEHISEVVNKAKELGCYVTNLMQCIPVPGSAFENLGMVPNKRISQLRREMGQTMRQMLNCRQCRADAIGTLGDDRSIEFRGIEKHGHTAGEKPKEDTPARPLLFAVASKGGVLVDQHFGQASDFYIYEATPAGVRLRERRSATQYCDGGSCSGAMDGTGKGTKGEGRIDEIVKTISDCAGVVCMRIGEAPRRTLAEHDIDVLTTYDRIEDAVEKAVEAYRAHHTSDSLVQNQPSHGDVVAAADNAAISADGVSGDALATPFTAPGDTTQTSSTTTTDPTTKEAIAR